MNFDCIYDTNIYRKSSKTNLPIYNFSTSSLLIIWSFWYTEMLTCFRTINIVQMMWNWIWYLIRVIEHDMKCIREKLYPIVNATSIKSFQLIYISCLISYLKWQVYKMTYLQGISVILNMMLEQRWMNKIKF